MDTQEKYGLCKEITKNDEQEIMSKLSGYFSDNQPIEFDDQDRQYPATTLQVKNNGQVREYKIFYS